MDALRKVLGVGKGFFVAFKEEKEVEKKIREEGLEAYLRAKQLAEMSRRREK